VIVIRDRYPTNVQYRHTNTVYALYIWRVNKRHMDTNVQYRHTNTVYVLYVWQAIPLLVLALLECPRHQLLSDEPI
jgi:hypothetical protein